MRRVAIIGTGFAALTAVRTLRAHDKKIGISVIGARPEFIFYPSLIWIPSGLRTASDLIIPLDNFFQRMGVDYHQGSATGLRDGGRLVFTENGEVANDGLIIASGGRFIKKLPGIEHTITPCEGISAVEAIRDRLCEMDGGTIAVGFAGNPKEPSAMRGGPMFEFLFGLHTQLEREGRRDRFKMIFFSPAAEPGKRLGPKAMRGLLASMEKKGIATHLGHKLKGFAPGRIQTEGGEILADLILFMPGMTGNRWFDRTDMPRSPGGLVQADAQCRVPGWERVYVAGDSGSHPGPEWLPKQAHIADLQAAVAARNLLTELDGGIPDRTFRHELACIVDDLETGILVARNHRGTLILPRWRIMHWVKRIFERWYLRKYR
ncbi:MAG: FAD-dependent oxidoreductase [Gammaproteobacteria bacterium]|nr:FAD-dependent oxidoreductase [Gammaproteobacteria bacterium]